MNTHFQTILLILALLLLSCSNGETNKNQEADKSERFYSEANKAVLDMEFNTDRKMLTNDFMTWYSYTYYNVRLSQNFIGLDLDSSMIEKKAFLNKLIEANVVAFKIKVTKGKPVYQLFELSSDDENIGICSKQMAVTEKEHFDMEGENMPIFSFTDLNGKFYDNSSTKEKIIVIKCWFIRCVACVKEFPELNSLVDNYKDRKDIQFVSLAMDTKQDLKNFLQKKEFRYAVVPDMKNFMVNQLRITGYPTHVLVGKDGKIIKVVNKIEDLLPFISEEDKKG